MNKENVLLIAVGGIGFRHFQALMNCQSDFVLYVVDVSREALEQARSYAEEQKSQRWIRYYSTVSEIESSVCFRIAIIATSSLVRRSVFEELITGFPVETIIFEKVLFPKVEDYDAVERLLEENHVVAYVNCPRRLLDIYRNLREKVCLSGKLHAQIKGNNWGLACNSIHMLDLFAYLSASDPEYVTCSGSLLEDSIYDSKRKGYIEFYGKLTGKIGEKTTYLIECGHGEPSSLIELFTDTTYFCIDEGNGLLTAQELNSGELVKQNFRLSYVSQTTTQVIDRLLSGQEIGLTRYEESKLLHIPILREFIRKRNEIRGKEDELCPIT